MSGPQSHQVEERSERPGPAAGEHHFGGDSAEQHAQAVGGAEGAEERGDHAGAAE